MKKSSLVLFLFFLLISCTHNDNKAGQGNTVAPGIKRRVMDIAINYARDKLKDSKKTVEKGGIVTIVNNQIKYVIDPSKIVVGLIDDDPNEDAIVSISSYNGQFLATTEHLILIKSNGKFKVTKVIERDMTVLKIKDRIIYVEIRKLPPDSPNYNCAICREVVKYKYMNGDLSKID
jgi:hypothetical protein